MAQRASRALQYGFFGAMVAAAVYFRVSVPPFQAVPSQSMMPALRVGDMVIVKSIAPSSIKRGDIIVVELPKTIQSLYGYPSSVVHRVVKIQHSDGSLTFRTKGDHNPGQDPYSVNPSEVRGIVTKAVPYLGFPILYLHSKQGLYFLLISLGLFGVYRVLEGAERREFSVKRQISNFMNSEVIRELERLEQGQVTTSLRIEGALTAFAEAMAEYAVHLKSHTESVQHMASSAAALQSSAEAQHEVLSELKRVLVQQNPETDVPFNPGARRVSPIEHPLTVRPALNLTPKTSEHANQSRIKASVSLATATPRVPSVDYERRWDMSTQDAEVEAALTRLRFLKSKLDTD